eukprot:9000102-Karenia_brevis.AAC.1
MHDWQDINPFPCCASLQACAVFGLLVRHQSFYLLNVDVYMSCVVKKTLFWMGGFREVEIGG